MNLIAKLAVIGLVTGGAVTVPLLPTNFSCEKTDTTVIVDDTSWNVAGVLCGPKRNNVVHLLDHGFTYDHNYWLGLGFKKQSYVFAAAKRGVTTFAFDQLGTGNSDHPDPNTFDFPKAADVVHQLVQQLRSGGIGKFHNSFSRVIGVGHSMGSATLELEAATYHDINALVMTDGTQQSNPDGIAEATAVTIQANTLPQFASLPANYLTDSPRTVFYDTSIADPKIIQRDAESLQTGTLGMLITLRNVRVPSVSNAVSVPVLEVVGQSDKLDCGPTLPCGTKDDIIAREKPLFSGAPSFDAFVIPGGHNTALHPDAPKMFDYILNWAKNCG